MTERVVIADRYELDELPIGRGGMGEVWGGYDRRLDRRVAVKLIRFPTGKPRDDMVQRFQREARITARLAHPGVPIVYDEGDLADGRRFLVMELIEGVTVSDLVAEEGVLPVCWVAAIAAQVCAVLEAAHANSLTHRDLTAKNLMVRRDGSVKVLDFGLAGVLAVGESARITHTGETLGTPSYMAPEQIMAGVSSPHSDLYSLGCLLQEMLTGTPPFAGPTHGSVMFKHVGEAPSPVRGLRDEVPAELEALVLELLQKKPEDRPASAADVYDRLLPFVGKLGALPQAVSPLPDTDPARMYAAVISLVRPADLADSVPQLPKPETRRPTLMGRSDLAAARAEAGDLIQMARFGQAATLLSGVAGPASVLFGADDSDVLSLRLELAEVLFLGGDFRNAAPAFKGVIAGLIDYHGPDSDLVFKCRDQEAVCHLEAGETRAALGLFRSLLRDMEVVVDSDDPRLFELRYQIGALLRGIGDIAAADVVLDALLSDVLRVDGEDSAAAHRIIDLRSVPAP